MTPYRQRQGMRISRGGAVLIALALALAGGAYWLGPMRVPPPQLELLLLDGAEAVPHIATRGVIDPEEGVLRVPLQLAMRNAGPRAVRPQQIALHLPAHYRVATPRGRLTGEVAAGAPLRRYVLPVAAPPLPPGAPPQLLPGLDTIWLEPDLPRYYCVAHTSDVPEFIPAPQHDPEALSQLQIFYSVRTASQQRSTGVLSISLDPSQLAVQPAPMPPAFPTVFEEPQAQVPELGPLRYGGSRTSWCGDPERPMELYSVTWLSAGGARFYVIYVQGEPRKHLYDLTGDGTIELETWDVAGDGLFEARRQARFPVPEFLQPRPPRQTELLLPDTAAPDPAWLALFQNTAAGPLRFARRPSAAQPPPSAAEGMAAAPQAPFEPLPPPDSAWLELFLDARAGPFRFSRGTRSATEAVAAQPPPAAEPGTAATAPATAQPDEPPLPVAEQEDTAAAEPEPPPPPRRVPLGTPVPIRPGGG